MTSETAFNLYIDFNIYLMLAAVVWIATTRILRRTHLRYSHEIRLQVAYNLLVAVAVLPIALLCVDRLGSNQAVITLSALSLSDFAVAQFLEGRIDMAPTMFEATLNLRDTLVRETVALNTAHGQLIAMILLGGAATGLFQVGRDIGRIRRILRNGFLLRRLGRIDIILTDEIRVPLSTRGWRRHYVVVPTEYLYRPGDLHIAVTHEVQHIRQGDVTWEVVMECLRPLLFWNPAFHYWKREIEERRELACDRLLLTRRTITAAEYSDCLFRTCERLLGRTDTTPVATLSVPFAHSSGPTARRVLLRRFEMLINPITARSTRWRTALFAPVLAVFLVTGLATQTSSEWSHDRIMLSTIVNLERLDSRTMLSPVY